jgi:hypothetical protein
MNVIGLVGDIDDGQSVASDDGSESLIEQCRIPRSAAELAGDGEGGSIDRCTDTYASHAPVTA